jgi:putative SOS response-associated peptidase YedK
MCGRYSLVCIDDLGNRFRVHNPMIGSRSHFNVCPGSEMPVIIRNKKDAITLMRWGLVPHWSMDPATSRKPINARVENLSEKSMFGPLLKHGRCLVPASGFYEWKADGARKIPFYIYLPESPIFAFAGLYDTWVQPGGLPLMTYTIITCESNRLLAGVHNRMPVILTLENEERWLSPDPPSLQDLAGILAPCPESSMVMIPVAGLVNNPSLDDERLIRPLDSSSFLQTFLTE